MEQILSMIKGDEVVKCKVRGEVLSLINSSIYLLH